MPDTSPASDTPSQGFSAYWSAIRTHKLLLATVTLVTVLAAFAWLQVRPDSYEATAQILVSPLDQGDADFLGFDLLRDSGDPTRTVETAATLVYTPTVAETTAQQMGQGWNQKEVLDSVKVEPEGQSNILAVVATTDDAATSTQLANRFANNAIEERETILSDQIRTEIEELDQLRADLPPGSPDSAAPLTERIAQLTSILSNGDPTLTVSRPATVPEAPVGIGAVMLIPIALITGLLLGCGAALLLTLVNPAVRDEEELISLWPLPVLTRVPESSEMKTLPMRQAQALPPPIREAFRTVVAQVNSAADGPRSILVTSPSSGDGKTTTAIGLALSFAASGRSVILADLDLRRPTVTGRLGVERDAGTVPLHFPINAGQPLHDQLYAVDQSPGLRLFTPQGIEENVSLLDTLNRRLPALLEDALRFADVIVIDSPPIGEISDALNISFYVDATAMVVRPGNSNRKSLAVSRELLTRTGREPLGFVLMGSDKGTTSRYYSHGMAATRIPEPQPDRDDRPAGEGKGQAPPPPPPRPADRDLGSRKS